MKYYTQDFQFNQTNKKSPEPLIDTRTSEETVSKDAHRFFNEIIKNTRSISTGEENKENEKPKSK